MKHSTVKLLAQIKQRNSNKLYKNSLTFANIGVGSGINNRLCSDTDNKKHQECSIKDLLRATSPAV
jgi:hypothetical protein